MSLKRQPTIKTLLILMAVVALLGASFPYVMFRFDGLVWIALVSALTFWCLVPLVCGLLIKSMKSIGVVCLGIAITAVSANCYAGLVMFDSTSYPLARHIAIYVISGPFDWVFIWGIVDTEDTAKLTMSFAIWLVAYVANGLLVAKSCRVRESPAHFMLRFRLRTLLIVVAVLAVPMAWLGYSLRWIAERRAAIQEGQILIAPEVSDTELKRAPVVLWVFGEQGYRRLFWYGSPSKIDDVRRLFPEASIIQRNENDLMDDIRS